MLAKAPRGLLSLEEVEAAPRGSFRSLAKPAKAPRRHAKVRHKLHSGSRSAVFTRSTPSLQPDSETIWAPLRDWQSCPVGERSERTTWSGQGYQSEPQMHQALAYYSEPLTALTAEPKGYLSACSWASLEGGSTELQELHSHRTQHVSAGPSTWSQSTFGRSLSHGSRDFVLETANRQFSSVRGAGFGQLSSMSITLSGLRRQGRERSLRRDYLGESQTKPSN